MEITKQLAAEEKKNPNKKELIDEVHDAEAAGAVGVIFINNDEDNKDEIGEDVTMTSAEHQIDEVARMQPEEDLLLFLLSAVGCGRRTHFSAAAAAHAGESSEPPPPPTPAQGPVLGCSAASLRRFMDAGAVVRVRV